MKQTLVVLTIVALATVATGLIAQDKPAPRAKYLIILQAGRTTHEGMARAVHALLYARELHEHGHTVTLLFDGAGTEWIEEWSKPDSRNKLTPFYRQLHALGITEVVCDYCAGAFQVKESLQTLKVPMTAEFEGHPSIAKWVNRGYQLVVL